VGPGELAAWWGTLGDPTLDALMQKAIAANLDLKLASARVREARAIRGERNSDLYPTVDVAGSVSRSQLSDNVLGAASNNDPFTLWNAGLDASWEIDVFGGLRRGIEASQADLEAQIEAERNVLVTLTAEVARNYTDLRGLQQRIIVTERSIAAQRETLELTEALSKAGLAADIETEQARAQVFARQSAMPTLRAQARASIFRISVLLGEPPEAMLAELSPTGAVPKPPTEIPVGLPSDLLRRRPDIRQAERQLAAATARIGVETAELFPKFRLTGVAGTQSRDFVDLFDMNSRVWSIAPGVSWRVFDRRAIRQRIEAADARSEQALIIYEQTLLTSLEDVENALTSLAEEQARMTHLKNATDASRRAVDLANARYASGIGDFLTVLVNQSALFDREDQLAQSEALVTRSVILLYKALGGGWDDSGYPDAEPAQPGDATPQGAPTASEAPPAPPRG